MQLSKERAIREFQVMNQSENNRFSIVPLLATLLPAVLAILTLNIIQDSIFLRFFIVSTLTLVPGLMWLYVKVMRKASAESERVIVNILKTDFGVKDAEKIARPYGHTFLKGKFPEIVIVISLIVILIIDFLVLIS